MPDTKTSNDLVDGWNQAMRNWWDQSQAAYEPWRTAWTSMTAKPAKRRSKGDCCDPCSCCTPEADIIVHARVGERRIVAFELRNDRHRERQVDLEIGAWTACGGPAVNIAGELDPTGQVTVASCDKLTIRLAITVGAGDPAGDQRTGLDVAACASAYADVRFEGCARPVRVAVVVHPVVCDSYEVTCGCNCCS